MVIVLYGMIHQTKLYSNTVPYHITYTRVHGMIHDTQQYLCYMTRRWYNYSIDPLAASTLA
jgi:hypothetical protein